MKNKQTITLILVLLLILGAISFLEKGKVSPSTDALVVLVSGPDMGSSTPKTTIDRLAAKAQQFEKAKEITTPDGFINTDGKPISLSDYVGKKVILLDIWTYSCINCVRTLPYLNDWYKKYEDKGLVIIGLHTPEFEFEKNYDNVKAAVEKNGIKFPVVLDNDFSTWTAYKNLYWPRKYLIDIDGFIRYDHIGEGGYDETEKVIQDLLKERADVLGTKVSVDTPITKGAEEVAPEYQSPETYFGSARNQYLGNGTPGMSLEKDFSITTQVSLGKFYFDGRWKIGDEYAENTNAPASIVYPFMAKKVFFVASADSPVRALIFVDGKQVNSITIKNSDLYNIYSNASSTDAHVLEVRPLDKGLKAFTFTFGN